jgi:RHS repeat-associated protein
MVLIVLACMSLGAARAQQAVNPQATSGFFYRPSVSLLEYNSFVVPVDLTRGVRLDGAGPSTPQFGGVQHWATRIDYTSGTNRLQLRHLTSNTNTPATYGLTVENALVVFGGQGGGSPLYVDQSYSFGAYAGARRETNASLQYIFIKVYNKSTNPGPSLVATVPITIPRKGTTAWSQYASNGFTVVTNAWGLNTTLRTVESDNAAATWSVTNGGPYLLTHTAQSTQYWYKVEVVGYVPVGGNWVPMCIDSNGAAAASPLYTLDFDPAPAWSFMPIAQPHFQGQPLPPSYVGKSPEELASISVFLTNAPPLAASNYLALNNSPELRTHPVLNQFVADMGNDPFALINYVFNEIELTDPLAYNSQGAVSEISVNEGGIARGALGVYEEGQGSPSETCGLLVYLLRQAGYPAAYVQPPKDAMLLRNTDVTRLLRTQVAGAMDPVGNLYTTNTLIAVNYPWVAVRLPDPVTGVTNWVHLFPWFKDTEIIEGRNGLYDTFPEGFRSGFQWTRQYLRGDTNILALDPEENTTSALFPKFANQAIQARDPRLSLSDYGYRASNRKHYRTRWQEFPGPAAITTNAFTYRRSWSELTNVFDTVSIRLMTRGNTNQFIDSNPMPMAELHNRRLLAYHFFEGGNWKMKLAMEPWATNSPGGVGTFFIHGTNTDLATRQEEKFKLLGNGDAADGLITVTFHRHRRFSGQTSGAFLNFVSTLVYGAEERPIKAGDMAAVCLNYGRVSPRMVRRQVQSYWDNQRKWKAGTQANEEEYHGALAHLMGLSYYQKVTAFAAKSEQWHKVRVLSTGASGLAMIQAQRNISGVPYKDAANNVVRWQPSVDMFFNSLAVLMPDDFAGPLHLDSGSPGSGRSGSFGELQISAISSEEHEAIHSFYRDASAVSTVRLLQMAQQAKATNALAPGIRELHVLNWISEGNIPYGGTNLKAWDPGLWARVSNLFTSTAFPVGTNYSYCLITPGPLSSPAVSTNLPGFRGLGAMLSGPTGDAALISGNMNGAEGSYQSPNNFFFSTAPNTQLSLNNNNTPSIDFNLFVGISSAPPLPELSLSFNASTVYSSPASAYTYTPVQQSWVPYLESVWGTTPASPLAADLTLRDTGATTSGSSYFGNLKTYVGQQVAAVSQGILDPVDSITGAFYIDEVDLTIPGPQSLMLRRNYWSQETADTAFGYGWKMSFLPYLQNATNVGLIYAADVDGSIIAYRQQTTNPSVYLPAIADNPTLYNQRGEARGGLANPFNAVLLKAGATNFTLTGSDGSVRRYSTRSYPLGSGTNQIARTRPYLNSWRDNRGNELRFLYGEDSNSNDFGLLRRIESSNGNFLGLQYDPFGHIVEAYVRDGRRVRYEYDQHGDLTRVVRPDGSELAYAYSHGSLTVTNNGVVIQRPYSLHLLTEETKPGGRLLVNRYDSLRRVTNQMALVSTNLLPVVNGTFIYSNNFSATNLLVTGSTTVLDAYNRPTRYDYTNGLIWRVTDPLNQVISQQWAQSNAPSLGQYGRSLMRFTDKRGLITEYRYDHRGNVTNVTMVGDLTGQGQSNETATTVHTFTTNNLPWTISGPDGNTTTFSYGSSETAWLPASIMLSRGGATISSTVVTYTNRVTSSNLFVKGLPSRIQQPDGAVTRTEYDSAGYPTSVTRESGTSDPNVVATLRYNLRGERVEQKDALGRTIRFIYDDMGRPSGTEHYETNGAIAAWEYRYYNGNGEVEWVDGPQYGPEDYLWRRYDGAGRQTHEIAWRSRADSSGNGTAAHDGAEMYAITTMEYDKFGNLTRRLDPRNHLTEMDYDAVGQMRARRSYEGTGALLSQESFGYEPGGEVSVHTNAILGVTTTLHTSRGQPYFRVNPDQTTHVWRYRLDGRLSRETFSDGSCEETSYDDVARSVTKSLRRADGQVLRTTSKTFDRRGNCTGATDAEGYVTTRTYDGLDRIKSVSGPAGGGSPQQVVTYVYDAAGRDVIVSNALGESTLTTRDVLGRVAAVDVRNTSGAVVRRTRHAYSADHHGVTTTEGSGTNGINSTTFTDTQGRPVIQRFASGGIWIWDYDAAGNRMTQSDPVGQVTRWTFDGLNRMISEVQPDGAPCGFTYDAGGNLVTRRLPGGLTETNTFNSAGQWTASALVNSGATTRNVGRTYFTSGPNIGRLQTVSDPRSISIGYYYDDFGRVLQEQATGPAPEHNVTRSYAYDRRGLATHVAQSYGSSTQWLDSVVTRSFDGYGQMLAESVTLGGAVVRQWSQQWNVGGRRTALTASSPASASYTFGYRADGLLTNATLFGQAASFTYADHGLLIARANPRVTSSLVRDDRGRVTSRSASGGGLSLAESQAWYDNGQIAALGRSFSGGTNAPASDTVTYNSDARDRITHEIAVSVAGTNRFHHEFDAQWSGSPWGLKSSSTRWQNTTVLWEHYVHAASGLGRWTSQSLYLPELPIYVQGQASGVWRMEAAVDGVQIGAATLQAPGGVSSWWWLPHYPYLPSGARTLSLTGRHASGFLMASNRAFSVSSWAPSLSSAYDPMGSVTNRPFGYGLDQTLRYDAFGRCVGGATVLASGQLWESWTAQYDGLGRRLRLETALDYGSATPVRVVADSVFDPQVEFLELAVRAKRVATPGTVSAAVADREAPWTWKLYGPDANGVYGGLQGLGGLELLIPANATTNSTGVLLNRFGDVVAGIGGTNEWAGTRTYSYGPDPTTVSATLMPGVPLWQALAWRGKWRDPSRLYWMGARMYDAESGTFLSCDPLGFVGQYNLYAFCNGDAVNLWDGDGRFGKQAQNLWNVGVQAGQNVYNNLVDHGPAIGIFGIAESFNAMNGNQWAQPATDDKVTAHQMFYQWVTGTGPDRRTFTTSSVMGQQMLQADYVQKAMQSAAQQAVSGSVGPVDVARRLRYQNPASSLFYVADFFADVSGVNPARGFQGSIAGLVMPRQPISIGNVALVPMTVNLTDRMTAVSGTRASGTVGGYDQEDPTAIYTQENPYGPHGPLRTIDVDYRLETVIVVPLDN